MFVNELLAGFRIGYLPSSTNLHAPSDRRRFVRYAQSRGLSFELADPAKKYDLVVLSQSADLSVWSRYRRGKALVVYDSIDSYMSAGIYDWKSFLRGTSKFITRRSRYLQINYRRAVAEMCSRADAVICSTEEQRESILPFCKNVHIILDMHDGDIGAVKDSYDFGQTVNVVWEGLASSGIPMEMMRNLLEPIAEKRKLSLHLITDLTFHRFHDRYSRRHTSDEVNKYFGGMANNVYLYQWNPFALTQIGVSADFAIIPIDLDNPFHCGKPENKLLLFWRMGIPTLVSATPAYSRAMQLAGLDLACKDEDHWRERLCQLMSEQKFREDAGVKGLYTANTIYSETQMLDRWDHVFKSIVG